jgi:RNA polymerase sigma-70 factor (ECF subfamily)
MLLEQVDALSRPMVTDKSASDQLRSALDSIPEDYALVMRLRFLDEMPLKRIAAFLGVPISTVKWRVHRGKALLRESVIAESDQRGEQWKEKKR